MNVNYIIGKVWGEIQTGVLRWRPPVLWNRYPRGRVFPLDLIRFSEAEPIRMILDIGANDGGTSLELSRWIPQATIHAFEPITETFEQLRRRTGHLRRMTPHQLACGAVRDRVQITLKQHSTINTLVGAVAVGAGELQAAERTPGVETIDVVTVDDFCREQQIHTIDLLKTDTEGFDMEVLQGAEEMLSAGRVRYVYAEVGFNGQPGQSDFCEIATLLRSHHFVLSGFYEPMRHGPGKKYLNFCNALFSRTP